MDLFVNRMHEMLKHYKDRDVHSPCDLHFDAVILESFLLRKLAE